MANGHGTPATSKPHDAALAVAERAGLPVLGRRCQRKIRTATTVGFLRMVTVVTEFSYGDVSKTHSLSPRWLMSFAGKKCGTVMAVEACKSEV